MTLSMLSSVPALTKQISSLGSLAAGNALSAPPPPKLVDTSSFALSGATQPNGLFDATMPFKQSPADLAGLWGPTASASPATTSPGTTPATNTGASLGGEWAGVDQWDTQIAAAAAKYGVPVNLIKSVMKLESDGNPNSAGAPGVWGPMQVNSSADAWGYGPWSTDAAANIDKGVQILADAYKGTGNWNDALIQYRGGWGTDGNTVGQQYLDIVNGNWDTLNNATGGAGLSYNSGNGAGFASIWGGADAPITQEFGWTDFARNSDYAKTAYDYTSDYTRDRQPMGHAGVDVGVNYGTALHAPGAGVVKMAGGTGYYCDSDQGLCGPGSGELLIEYANGDQVILGHMQNISVHVGDTVQPGQVVGTSGGENGAHVHVEYRRYVGAGVTNSGYEVVDPRQALGGVIGTPGMGSATATAPAVEMTPAQRIVAFMHAGR